MRSFPADFINKIICGDCLELYGMMNSFNFLIKRFSELNNFGFHWSFSWRTTKSRIGIIFAFSQLKNSESLGFFNSQKWKEFFNCICRKFITGLVAIKRTLGIFTVHRFMVIITAKSFFKKFDSRFFSHSDLYSFVILGISTIFSTVCFFNSHISLSINKTSQVCNQFIFSHISLIPQMGG